MIRYSKMTYKDTMTAEELINISMQELKKREQERKQQIARGER